MMRLEEVASISFRPPGGSLSSIYSQWPLWCTGLICLPMRTLYLILSESEGWGMCVQADSCMACWYIWSLESGTGPRGHTPNDGGMLTSDSEGWGAVGGPGGAVDPEKMSGAQDSAVSEQFLAISWHFWWLTFRTNLGSLYKWRLITSHNNVRVHWPSPSFTRNTNTHGLAGSISQRQALRHVTWMNVCLQRGGVGAHAHLCLPGVGRVSPHPAPSPGPLSLPWTSGSWVALEPAGGTGRSLHRLL